ncbi:excinuclease ABC subunit UvrC [Clostridium cylindrosporum]|uniref:UvrABC system protein C n=1 Tax=Clostridium cylindrosporum DSM 605 TaxID=1121307 RepID=A0A0J8D5H3_CLOCY|nr:excinuclease ABC subunit UvrC [Clostridium cylindrosporum]KMT21072.1 UvrABC system protein C [Clostridium cylindrosporum DSM 605]
MFDLEEALKGLPSSPGVYIMKDEEGEIIYIGKAVSLKNRVRQYFRSNKNHPPKVVAMVRNIAEFEYILTDSELEALILECNLIKKHKPKYNILLKDDKHYPYIKVTTKEEYPKVLMTRRYQKDGSKYFGPYTDVSAVKETLLIIEKHFKLRNCKRAVAFGQVQGRPCLNFHIDRCIAPCTGKVTREEYMKMIEEVLYFLSGKDNILLNSLEEEMKRASSILDFEKAMEIRDEIMSIKKIREKQKIISSALEDEDVIAFSRRDNNACIEVFFVRGGKLLGRENFYFEDIEEESTLLYSFITQFYSNREYIPREILLQDEISEVNIIESFLSSKKGNKVKIKIPKRGDKSEILEMARKNAEAYLDQVKYRIIKEKQSTIGAIEEIQAILSLENLPRRIESYDISNIQGTDPVGSMVVFEDGKPSSKDYRRFKIKTVVGPDDYGSIREILTRRFERGLSEIRSGEKGGRFSRFPDLILMDGGTGQVNIALDVLKKLGINIPVSGMVKDSRHRTRGLIYDGCEIDILKDSNAFKLITRIQDEVHRVAITYHRSLRSKSLTTSELDNIKGIGDKRKKALLAHFGSIENIKKASLEEILSVNGMNRPAAEVVVNYFSN